MLGGVAPEDSLSLGTDKSTGDLKTICNQPAPPLPTSYHVTFYFCTYAATIIRDSATYMQPQSSKIIMFAGQRVSEVSRASSWGSHDWRGTPAEYGPTNSNLSTSVMTPFSPVNPTARLDVNILTELTLLTHLTHGSGATGSVVEGIFKGTR